MFERFDEIFKSCGWRVVELRYGKKLAGSVGQACGPQRMVREALQRSTCPALHYQGGAAWRSRIDIGLGKKAGPFLRP
jgi:pyruvate dehydrogenase E1 component